MLFALRRLPALHQLPQWLHGGFVLAFKQQTLCSFSMPRVRVVEEGDEVGGARGAEFGSVAQASGLR
jgi:hypothetical protein